MKLKHDYNFTKIRSVDMHEEPIPREDSTCLAYLERLILLLTKKRRVVFSKRKQHFTNIVKIGVITQRAAILTQSLEYEYKPICNNLVM